MVSNGLNLDLFQSYGQWNLLLMGHEISEKKRGVKDDCRCHLRRWNEPSEKME